MDSLDSFLSLQADPKAWRTLTPDNIPLTKEELEIISALFQGTTADIHFDPFAPSVDFFTGTLQLAPIASKSISLKRQHLPSFNEAKIVKRLVHAIRKGWIKMESSTSKQKSDIFDLWSGSGQSNRRSSYPHIPAPKLLLPNHYESYHPPPEYIPTGKAKYTSLRHVPSYPYLIAERFSRCLDLVLCPRAKRTKLNIDPESLLPKLPDLSDLRPYPNKSGLLFNVEEKLPPVTCIDIDPTGHWLLTGYADGSISICDARIGKILARWMIYSDEKQANTTDRCHVNSISWNPSSTMAAIACGTDLTLINPFIGNSTQVALIEKIFLNLEKTSNWSLSTFYSLDSKKIPLTATRFAFKTVELIKVAWHRKGEYLATVAPRANNSAITIFQVLKGTAQSPFKKIDGMAIDAAFHPTKPHFYLATQKSIKLYDLSKQIVIRKIELRGINNPSIMQVHPKGEHLLLGSSDSRVSWYDVELSTTGPYSTLRYHKGGINCLSYHPRYPLFASCGGEGTVHVCYGRVFEDSSLQNPQIVPVKILKPWAKETGSSLSSVAFHPIFPWVYTGGTAGMIELFIPTIY